MTVTVNGKTLQVPKTMPDWQGKPAPTTMLQAAKIAGVDIPHYCYHDKLPVAGNCRMCLVEFGTPMVGPDRKPVLNEDGTPKIAKSVLPYEPGTPRGAIACATPISPGMEIYANSKATEQMRESVLESLPSTIRSTAPFAIRPASASFRNTRSSTARPAANSSRPRSTSPRRSISAHALFSMTSVASCAPGAFASLATSPATTLWVS